MDKEFIENPVEAYDKLKAENERLKEEVETWKYQTQKSDEMADEDYKKAKKYKSCLQEIKEIAEEQVPFIDFSQVKSCIEIEYNYASIVHNLEKRMYKILQKIAEVENG